MSRKLKLDLHTHLDEATSAREPTADIVLRVVQLARSRGLDGLALTSHNNPEYGFKFKAVADEVVGDGFVVIPGQEMDQYSKNRQILELYLPGGVTFRVLAHPGVPSGNLDGDLSDLHGIEIRNSVHDWHIETERVLRLAQEYQLILVGVSDSHYLHQLGKGYTLTNLEELSARVRNGTGTH